MAGHAHREVKPRKQNPWKSPIPKPATGAAPSAVDEKAPPYEKNPDATLFQEGVPAPDNKPVPGENGQSKSRLIPNELITRAVAGAVVVGLVLAGIRYGDFWWNLVAGAVAVLSLWEFYKLLESFMHVSKGLGVLAGVGILAATACMAPERVTFAILAGTAMFLLLIEVLRRGVSGKSNALLNMGGTLAGLLYVVFPWSFMMEIRSESWGYLALLGLFVSTWACDVFAYLVGSLWGSMPLAPRVSPKKSVEGALGGLLGALFASGLLAFYYEIPPLPMLLVGFLCGTLGQLGDLAESVLKREANVKESGTLIPGHGGVLDRFDSILFSATGTYILFEVIWR